MGSLRLSGLDTRQNSNKCLEEKFPGNLFIKTSSEFLSFSPSSA
jgi:hypothetical protein